MASSKKSGRFIPLQTEAAEAWAWLRDYLTAIKHGTITNIYHFPDWVRLSYAHLVCPPLGSKQTALIQLLQVKSTLSQAWKGVCVRPPEMSLGEFQAAEELRQRTSCSVTQVAAMFFAGVQQAQS